MRAVELATCIAAIAIAYALSSWLIGPALALATCAAIVAIGAVAAFIHRQILRNRALRAELALQSTTAAELRRKDAELRVIANTLPALISYVDAEYRFRLVNATYERWFGKRSDQIEGRTGQEVLGDRMWTVVKPYVDRALGGESVTYEERLTYPDGPRWVRIAYVPDRGADGKVRGMVVLVTDIGERKRVEYAIHRAAERSRQLHRITTALAGTMTYEDVARTCVAYMVETLDADGGYIGLLSSDGRTLLPVEHVATRLDQLALEDESPAADALRSQAPIYVLSPEERKQRYPELGSPFEGDPVQASVSIPLLVGERPLGVFELFWSKVTAFREEDRHFISALARECAQAMERARLYASEQQARARAEASDKAKDQFIAVLSHELRTPLTPVLTAAQMLEASEPSTPHAQVRSMAALIRKNAELEARLIDDLLDLTRISRGKLSLHFEAVDAHAKVREVLRACESDLEFKQLRVETALEAQERFVHADQARFQQVIWNLVKNAVKFSHKGGRVFVRTRIAPDGNLLLEVCDEGVGIEPELLPRLFNAFEQGSREVTRHFGGLGLGLAVSKALVEAQGGRISAASAGRNRGSTFSISMPLTQVAAHAEAIGAVTHKEQAQDAHRILLVEDHEDTSEILAEFLEARGYRVKTADTVASALRIADAEPFDLVLSDLGLPDGTGYDLMRQLQARHHLRGVALSGYGRDKDVEEAKAAGFQEHVTKPPNPEQLLTVLSRVLH